MAPHYDVFLCHHGPDTKRNLVSVLSGMLCSIGITCFVDHEIREGSEIVSGITDALESSSVHVVIFSPNFETSKRALDEVVQIINLQSSAGASLRPRKVIPLFCDVEPSEVRQRASAPEYILKRGSA
ncbi:hypothetical protein KP509_15G048800 [Ceratopteris richardii]|uniref:ADP-ribosyl cyclase/cyclic ADP-ribose hydrolase n=1 Tax=Ceratopteris richardii TaxID=49495 RepID=A0A8T2T598_CERRI|nr:hypothetical protein KP509_15G048800 [Ceratopteris richardii]